MVDVEVVKQRLADYLVKQIDTLGEVSPAIKLLKPLAKRAISNRIDSFDKFINLFSKDGKLDVDGIFSEEIEAIQSINNFNFEIPFFGTGNISNGSITIPIPLLDKGIMLNTSDLETLRQTLIQS